MNAEDLKKINLPDTPGVYFFKDGKGTVLYIGKATSIKDRVRSYFGKDLVSTRGPIISKVVLEAKTITSIETDSVLEALILEANLIRKYLPKGNVKEKDDKSYNYVIITKEQFPRVLVARGRDILRQYPQKNRLYIIGPFPEGKLLKSGMRIVRKIFPFRDKCFPYLAHLAAKPQSSLGVSPLSGGKPCFNRQIGLCPGVCTGEISAEDYKKIIKNLILFFEGKKSRLISNLNKQMKSYARAHQFEKAGEMKRTIFALGHIQDISLIKEEPCLTLEDKSNFRIEAYDVAHIRGKEMVGAMVVIEDGKAKKSDYRKFKIRTIQGPNDTGALKEIMERRFTHAWPIPNLIVVDGSLAQRNAALKIISKNRLSIPVVSVVKDKHHKPKNIEGESVLIKKYRKEILLGNAEAHRFAIAYHKKLRQKTFLNSDR